MPTPISAAFGFLPWFQREREATKNAEITNRGAFLPLSEYSDGKVHPSIPGAILDLPEVPKRLEEAYNSGDEHALGRETFMMGLNGLGMGTMFGAVPKGAFAANSARTFDDVPWDLPDLKSTGAADPFDMPPSMQPQVSAPAVKRSEGEIFDYSHHRDEPVGNPLGLEPLDYFKSRVKVKPDSDAEKVLELSKSRKVQNTVNKAVERGLAPDSRNAVMNWYNAEPLRERFHDLYRGSGSPDAAFLKLMQAVGTTSPMNSVLPNAAEATRIYKYLQQGQEIPRVGKEAGLSGIAANGKAILSRKKFGQEPGYNPKDSQKTEFFGRSLAGDDSKVVVDSHAMRGLTMPTRDPRYLAGGVRFKADHGGYETYSPRAALEAGEVTMDDLQKSPTDWLSQPPDAAYGAAAKPYERAAQKFGLSPGQAQAAAWYGNADMTGVVTQPKTFNELFEQRLRENATAMGIEPERLLERVINGEEYLLGVAPLPMPTSSGTAQEER